MTNTFNTDLRRKIAAAMLACGGLALVPDPAGATAFRLTATDVVVETPAPLFSSSDISGYLILDDAILPGQSFGSASITGLKLNFGGIVGTLADVTAEISPGAVQAFGTRSADGKTLSVFDFRFGFPSGVKGCSFICAGQIIINSPIGGADVSNFIAIDDPDVTTLSIIDSYTPHFELVPGGIPEPSIWGLMILGLGLTGVSLRRRGLANPI